MLCSAFCWLSELSIYSMYSERRAAAQSPKWYATFERPLTNSTYRLQRPINASYAVRRFDRGRLGALECITQGREDSLLHLVIYEVGFLGAYHSIIPTPIPIPMTLERCQSFMTTGTLPRQIGGHIGDIVIRHVNAPSRHFPMPYLERSAVVELHTLPDM